MDGDLNPNYMQREARFRAIAQRERTSVFARAQRIMEMDLAYVPNAQFKLWSRDKKTENEVLGPMPACSEPQGKNPAPAGLTAYVASLYETPLLTREQEVHLFRKMNYLKYKASTLYRKLSPLPPPRALLARMEKLRQKIVAAQNQIISANLRLVVWIAKWEVWPAQNFFELVSDGNVSLMQAVERFDYSLGNRFSTYATSIIARTFVDGIAERRRQRARFRSGCPALFATTPEVRSNEYELEAVQSCHEAVLNGILRRLNDREREILVCRFGLRRDQEPQTGQQVGWGMGLSKARIYQIEARALRKLRQALVQETLPGVMEKRALPAQAKILRVLETRSLRRLGGSEEIALSVRVIATTNAPLEELVQSGQFRRDLFYRLNAYAIHLLPLRQRREHILPLAEHFLRSYASAKGLSLEGFDAHAAGKLLEYDFPGNARELRYFVQRAAMLCPPGPIRAEHLGLPAKTAPAVCVASREEQERTFLLDALEEARWNCRRVAQRLGLPYSGLRYKMCRLGIKK